MPGVEDGPEVEPKSTGDDRSQEQAPIEPAEKELKEPTLKEQASIYADMFGVDQAEILKAAQSLQSEMSKDERKELTMLIYCPENFGMREAAKKFSENGLRIDPYRYDYFYDERRFKTIITEGETENGIVAFGCYSQVTDDKSKYIEEEMSTPGDRRTGRSVEDLEKTGQKFMSPKLWLLASIAFFKATGKHMDAGYGEREACVCPGSRYRYNEPAYKGHAPFN